ncbi:MAG: helix-turn-helix domain-containing protein [Actinomycetota bacterium]|nr:helix-turn-helix domain-containing protein [Actinomycetota bacterium]
MRIERLASVRRDRGLTQAQLAERLGMQQPRISNMETGLSISRTLAERIAAELLCSVEDIKTPTEPTVTFKVSELPPQVLALLK